MLSVICKKLILMNVYCIFGGVVNYNFAREENKFLEEI
jgi:hypothetical protein